MQTRRNPLGTNLSRRELRHLLILAIMMVLAVLYGLYIGWWSLHKEEEEEHSPKTRSELRMGITSPPPLNDGLADFHH